MSSYWHSSEWDTFVYTSTCHRNCCFLLIMRREPC